MLVRIHHLSHLGRIIVSLVASLVFAMMVLSSSAQPGYSVEGQLATHGEKLAHLSADQAHDAANIEVIQRQLAAQSDRLTRIEMFGAACFAIITVMQILGAISGRKLRITAGAGE